MVPPKPNTVSMWNSHFKFYFRPLLYIFFFFLFCCLRLLKSLWDFDDGDDFEEVVAGEYRKGNTSDDVYAYTICLVSSCANVENKNKTPTTTTQHHANEAMRHLLCDWLTDWLASWFQCRIQNKPPIKGCNMFINSKRVWKCTRTHTHTLKTKTNSRLERKWG